MPDLVIGMGIGNGILQYNSNLMLVVSIEFKSMLHLHLPIVLLFVMYHELPNDNGSQTSRNRSGLSMH